MRVRVLIWLLLLPGLGLADATDELVSAVQAYQTFSAKAVHIQQGQTSPIDIWVSAPDSFRIVDADGLLTVSNGNVLWMYDPDLQQAVKEVMNRDLARIPLLLFGTSASAVREHFRVSAQRRGTLVEYLLEPTGDGGDDQLIRQLIVRMENGRLREFQWLDLLNNSTVLRFHTIRLEPPDSSLFVFTPPEGVRTLYIER